VLKCDTLQTANTHTHLFNSPFSGTTRVSRYQKGKPIWILLKQETVSSWAICKSAPCIRQITTPAPHHSVFYRPDALPGSGVFAKNGGGYTQMGVAKGLKVPCLFMITEVSIRCQKKPGGWYTPYTRVYPPNTPLLPGRLKTQILKT